MRIDSTGWCSAKLRRLSVVSRFGCAEPAVVMKASEEGSGGGGPGDTAGASFARGIASVSGIVSVLSRCTPSLHPLPGVSLPCQTSSSGSACGCARASA